jgi:hypothetical protein
MALVGRRVHGVLMDPDDPTGAYDFLSSVPAEWTERYYANLGKMVHMFGRAEDSLSALIQIYANAQMAPKRPQDFLLLRAAVVRRGLQENKELLMRMLRASGAPEEMRVEVTRILDHFGEVQRVRNLLVHGGAYGTLGWLATSNDHTTPELGKAKGFSFRVEVLDHMARDLEIIPMLLQWAVFPDTTQSSSEVLAYMRECQGPWKFSPTQLLM